MVDEALLNQAKVDVEAALEVWKELIEERLGDVVDFAYVTGSALKKWESPIDYVPLISDVDIHIKTLTNRPLFTPDPDGFTASLELTRLYEERFKERNSGYLHIPRPQIVTSEEHDPDWGPQDLFDVKILYGDVKPGRRRPGEEVRANDLTQLLELGQVLPGLPVRVVDRIGLEYYRIIRELCWRVSPTPVRLLNQMADSEYVWSLNRTRVVEKLDAHGFDNVTQHYKAYYLAGWTCFKTRFQDNDAMRKTIREAYWVLYKSWAHAKKMSEDPTYILQRNEP